MVLDKKWIKSVIDSITSSVNFRRKGDTWYSESNDFHILINLQKSNWGKQFYLNLGVSIKGKPDGSLPQEKDCNLRVRLSELFLDQKYFDQIMDFENDQISITIRKETIENAIANIAIPFLESINTISSMKERVSSGVIKLYWIDLDLKKILGIEE